MYILINHWITRNTTGIHCLKHRKNLNITVPKCLPRVHTKISVILRYRRTETTLQERVDSLNHTIHWTCGWRRGANAYMFAFVLEADTLSIWCKDDVTYCTFDDFWGNAIFNWNWYIWPTQRKQVGTFWDTVQIINYYYNDSEGDSQ